MLIGPKFRQPCASPLIFPIRLAGIVPLQCFFSLKRNWSVAEKRAFQWPMKNSTRVKANSNFIWRPKGPLDDPEMLSFHILHSVYNASFQEFETSLKHFIALWGPCSHTSRQFTNISQFSDIFLSHSQHARKKVFEIRYRLWEQITQIFLVYFFFLFRCF